MVMFINDKHGELLGQERRRRWSPEQNLAMVRESLEPGKAFRWWPGATVSMPTSCSCGASCIRTAACRRSVLAKPWCLPPSWVMRSSRSVSCNGCWARKRWKQKASKRPWSSPGRENGLRTHPCCRWTTGEAGQHMSRSDSTAAKVAREGTRCSVSLLALVAHPRCV